MQGVFSSMPDDGVVLSSCMPDPTPSLCPREQHGFVRVATVSPELKLGDVAANVAILRKEMQHLASQGCRLIGHMSVGFQHDGWSLAH